MEAQVLALMGDCVTVTGVVGLTAQRGLGGEGGAPFLSIPCP